MNVLGDMLRIKIFRQDKAEFELANARAGLERATEALKDARDALQACRVDGDRRERALYAELCAHPVRLADLDDVALQVRLMRNEIETHAQAVEAAETARKTAVDTLDAARKTCQDATRAREKFFELDLAAGQERLLALGRAEELEMEEAVVSRPLRVGRFNAGDAGMQGAA